MNALTDKTHVLVTRLGDFWVSAERGAKAMQIKMQDNMAQIEMDGSYIVAANIDGLLTAAQYGDLQNKRRGLWQCGHKQWHNRNDTCYCARNAAVTRHTVTPVDDRPPMTAEQKQAATQRLAAMRAKLLRKKGKIQ